MSCEGWANSGHRNPASEQGTHSQGLTSTPACGKLFFLKAQILRGGLSKDNCALGFSVAP